MSAAGRPGGLYVIGFGGHARSVADIALSCGFSDLIFIEEMARPAESFAGFPVEARAPAEWKSGWQMFPAAGDNRRREAQAVDCPLKLASLVSPKAHVGVGAEIGPAVLVAHGAHIGPLARIGAGVIVNTGAIVEHESIVGAFAHVSVNATVAGRCTIGARAFVGAGAVVIDRVSVCDDAVIGAGAVVIREIVEAGTYVGSPARRLR